MPRKSLVSAKTLVKAVKTPAEAAPEPYTLKSTLKSGQTKVGHQATYMVEGVAMNALVGLAFARKLGDLDLTECFSQMLVNAEATSSGDLTSQESILAAQIISTNAIYTELALLAHSNLGKGLEVFERLLRLALKAQSNCRATVETLAFIQNPPTLFAKQANISNGPQQVNNGFPPSEQVARAKESGFLPNELLEAHGERLDGGTPDSTGDRNQDLATVGAIDRSSERRR